MSHKQLTFNDRLQIEAWLKADIPVKKIAELVGCHISTIYREKKRGQYEHLNTDYTTEMRYSPDIAQQYIDKGNSGKGPNIKLDKNYDYANDIEKLIVEDGYSPRAAIAKLKDKYDFTICVNTLYSYIYKGVFASLSLEHLPVKRNEKKHEKRRVQKRASRGTSIEKRPDISDRQEFGHWEMDSVVGPQGKSKNTLLVLTERKTRKEIIIKLKDHTAASVVRALDRLERKMGAEFYKIFKTITVDNGTEFSDCEGMERSKRNKHPRTVVYYCHPYSSWERGTNENQNRLIRRHIPKGINFDDVPRTQIQKIADWINNYPRRLFDYKTSNELYKEEIDKINAA